MVSVIMRVKADSPSPKATPVGVGTLWRVCPGIGGLSFWDLNCHGLHISD